MDNTETTTQRSKASFTFLEKFSVQATRWVGSIQSLVIHTILFVSCFFLILIGIDSSKVMLVLTTIVSLEAIYLSIFIQMSVNRQGRKLREVSRDIEGIQEDVEEISEDVEEIQKDVEEIQEDVGDLQEDVEEISEEEDEDEEDDPQLEQIQKTLETLIKEMNQLKKPKSKTIKPQVTKVTKKK